MFKFRALSLSLKKEFLKEKDRILKNKAQIIGLCLENTQAKLC